jgi:hypothetical protein
MAMKRIFSTTQCISRPQKLRTAHTLHKREKLACLNYLRQIVEQLPLYTNQGRDWHYVSYQQDYYGHKFCGIYSIEEVPRALPVYNHRSRSRFLLASEFDYPETPDILSHL